MATTLNMQLLLRRAEFADSCVLAAGEPGYHTSTKVLKIGDGTTTWAELPFANQEQIEALIKVVNDKVEALNNTYATDAEVEAVRAALDAAKLDKATYEAYIATHAMTDTQITDAIGVVDAKFAAYRTAADQDAIDATLATKTALKDVTDTIATYGDIVTHNVAEFATAEQGAKADAAAVKTEVEAALALKADKSVVDAMYTNAKIDELVQGAKDYADANDANTEYHVEYDSENKKIKLVAGADASKMEIDATDFIKDGMIDTVTIGDDNDLVITFNTAAGKDTIVLPLDQLVDIYTGSTGARVTVTVGSDKSISAELVAGSISKNYLDADVQASLGKADSALQAADLNDYAKTADVVTNAEFEAFETANTAAIGAKLDASVYTAYIAGKELSDAELKAYSDGKLATARTEITAEIGVAQAAAEKKATEYNTAMDTRVQALENNTADYATKTEVATAVSNFNTETVAPLAERVTDLEEGLAAVDTGVMEVAAGTDIVVTPGDDGVVTVAHAEYQTGTIKAAEGVEEPNFLTSITIKNGHVQSANVQTLKAALESMEFIIDGGTSAN